MLNASSPSSSEIRVLVLGAVDLFLAWVPPVSLADSSLMDRTSSGHLPLPAMRLGSMTPSVGWPIGLALASHAGDITSSEQSKGRASIWSGAM